MTLLFQILFYPLTGVGNFTIKSLSLRLKNTPERDKVLSHYESFTP